MCLERQKVAHELGPCTHRALAIIAHLGNDDLLPQDLHGIVAACGFLPHQDYFAERALAQEFEIVEVIHCLRGWRAIVGAWHSASRGLALSWGGSPRRKEEGNSRHGSHRASLGLQLEPGGALGSSSCVTKAVLPWGLIWYKPLD